MQEEQIKKLQTMKQQRDNESVQNSLLELKKVAESKNNIMPAILDAVKVYATLGEICGVLREVFGEYKETIVL